MVFNMIRIVGMRIMIVVPEVLIMRDEDYAVMPSAMVFRLMSIAMTKTMLVFLQFGLTRKLIFYF